FSRKISYRPRPEHAGVARAPGTIRFHIFPLTPISVIDTAVQHHFARAPFDAGKRDLAEKRDGVLVELPPARRVQFTEKARGVVVPAPPEITRESPQALLRRSNKSIQRARLTHDRSNLGRRLDKRTDLFFAENSRFDGLHHQYTLQNAAIDQRHTQE